MDRQGTGETTATGHWRKDRFKRGEKPTLTEIITDESI